MYRPHESRRSRLATSAVLLISACWGLAGAGQSGAAAPLRVDEASQLYARRAWFGAATAVTAFDGRAWAGVGGQIWSWPLDAAVPLSGLGPDSGVLPGRVNDLMSTGDALLAAIAGRGVLRLVPGLEPELVPVAGGAWRLWHDGARRQVLVVTETGAVAAIADGPGGGLRWRYEPEPTAGRAVEVCTGSSIGVLLLQQQQGGANLATIEAVRISETGLVTVGSALRYTAAGAELALGCRAATAEAVFDSTLVTLAPGEGGGLRETGRVSITPPGGPIAPTALVVSEAESVLAFEQTLTGRGGVCRLREERSPRCWSFQEVVDDVALAGEEVLVADRALGVLRIGGADGAQPEPVFEAAGVADDLAPAGAGAWTVPLRQGGLALIESAGPDVSVRQARLTEPLVEGFVSVRRALALAASTPGRPLEEIIATGMDGEIHSTSVYTAAVPRQAAHAGLPARKLFGHFGFLDARLLGDDLYLAVRFGNDGLYRRSVRPELGELQQLAIGPTAGLVQRQGGVLVIQGRRVLSYAAGGDAAQELVQLDASIATEIASAGDGRALLVADYPGNVYWYRRDDAGRYRVSGTVALPGQISALALLDEGSALAAVPLNRESGALTERGRLDLGENVSARSALYLLRHEPGGSVRVEEALSVPGTVLQMGCPADGCAEVWVAASHGGVLQLAWRPRSETATPTPSATAPPTITPEDPPPGRCFLPRLSVP